MHEEIFKQALPKFSRLKIGVLGDFAIDAYWILEDSVGEISVETGKQAFVVRSQRYSLGGAGNILANLAALGIGRIEAFGVIGADLFSRQLAEEFARLGVATGGMISQAENWQTPVWAKPHIESEEQRRLDFGFYNRISKKTKKALFKAVEKRLSDLDALIVNQQLPRPLISEQLIGEVNSLIQRFSDKVIIVDSRDYFDRFQGAILKLDQGSLIRKHRGVESLDPEEENIGLEESRQALDAMFSGYSRPIILTRGKHGCLVYDQGTCTEIPGVFITGPVDPVGAGDTWLAAVTATLAAGLPITEAAQIGNYAASVTVTKLKKTGTATGEEILKRIEEGRLVFRPDLAGEMRNARYLTGTEIEIVNPNFERGRIRQVLFDHDGTISTLRQGWEPIMEEVMLESIFGQVFSTVSSSEVHRVQARVKEFIDQSTGVQTIVQMQGLADMVQEFGYIPKDEILDARGYKEVFNIKLMEMVNSRLARLDSGEFVAEDLTVKGSVQFLKNLVDKKIRCYLASGTDLHDVTNEAGKLGYAGLFGDEIYGSVGDINKFSKRKLIARIIEDHGLEGPQLCTFGDGPVEIAETKKRGGIAVGIASDEVRRRGLNPAKRERLVKAGADIIVPDFRQGEKLLEYLIGKG